MNNLDKFNKQDGFSPLASLMADGYKTGHHIMYPNGTKFIVDTFTPRSVKYMPEGAKDIVAVGNQLTVKYIQDLFQRNFFDLPRAYVRETTQRYLTNYLGADYDASHFVALHDLGFLPITFMGMHEGTITKPGIPTLAYFNDPAYPEFYWLPNFLETLVSTTLWKIMHSASLMFGFKKIITKYALETDEDNVGATDFQLHDFSMRGMQGDWGAVLSSVGFSMLSKGSDTLPVIPALEYYYLADEENSVHSVNATEHSVMTPKGPEGEFEQYQELLKKFPKGILSVVSDSYDLWQVLLKYLPILKESIMLRDGKIVVRPDSGDPVDILCGTFFDGYDNFVCDEGEPGSPSTKGVIELLWEVFGGTVNAQGYKVLDSHIGAIYGDSITLERATRICKRLKSKGFATTNVVLGIGSYSMGYATRDSQGSAVKAVHAWIGDEAYDIYKDPITDDGTKKSLKGLPVVFYDENGEISVRGEATIDDFYEGNLLEPFFVNGEFTRVETLEEIRTLLDYEVVKSVIQNK